MLAENTVLTGRRAITRSYAKINLTLDVLSKRENGYHDIKMIMQTVSLFDLILVDKTHRGISVSYTHLDVYKRQHILNLPLLLLTAPMYVHLQVEV